MNTLYLSAELRDGMVSWQPGRGRPRTPWSSRPCSSKVAASFLLNKPEQLRGPLSPYRKDGTQNGDAEAIMISVLTRMSHGMRRRLCVLDIQDSCYYSSRSSRPAGLFSFDLLDGPQVRLRRPHLREAPTGFGLSRFATVFMNNPGSCALSPLGP